MIIEHKYENEVVFKEQFAVVGKPSTHHDVGRFAAHGLDSYEAALNKGAEFIAAGAAGFRIDKRYMKVTAEELEQWRAEQEHQRAADVAQMEQDMEQVSGVSEVQRGKVGNPDNLWSAGYREGYQRGLDYARMECQLRHYNTTSNYPEGDR